MSRSRRVIVLVMLIVLSVTLVGTFMTRGVMEYLPFLQARKGNWTGAYVPLGVVVQRPWQTAATLASLAQSTEERKIAREAERLADHEVDQAFSQSLRQAALAKPTLTGKALALQQRVNELQETTKNDEARIASPSSGAGSRVQIKVTKVAGSVYMLEGAGSGNIGASVGDDGIVLIDDQYAPLAEKIQAALKGITDKPVRFVINTHYHDDHTGGNVYFQKQAPIIAHDNVRKRLESGGPAGNGSSVHFDAKPQPKEALPIITFDHDVTVHLNGEDIRALYFPAGHTDGDSIVFFPKSNVVHMGDDFGTYGFPFIDVDSGGSINGMIDAVEKVIAQLPPDVKVIPGHGAVCNLDDMRVYVKMLKETREVVQKALKEGKTFDQMKQARILDPWKKYSGDFITEDAYLETLFNSLTGQKNGKFIKHN